MRILQLCADRGIPLDGSKGAAVHLRSMASAFHRQGHDVRLLMANVGEDRNVAKVFSAQLLEPGSLKENAGRWGAPDLIYERYALGHIEGIETARSLGVPFVLEVNAPLFLEASRHRSGTVRDGHEDAERKLFRSADLVVAVSEPLRRYVAEIRGTDRGTVVVRNGCDPAMFPFPAPLRARIQQRLVFLGSPKPWHGADQLPLLVANLRRRGWDVDFLLIGGGPGADAVAERARELGVEDHVEITGPLRTEDALARVREGVVGVAPYPPDPQFYFCPLKVIECMAAGLPIVTTSQGDLSEVVGDAGILVRPGDHRALADAVEVLLRNEPLRRGLGARGRERALSRFTWDRAAERVIRAAMETVATRRRVA
ncbi:MAG TPA: glycosyltransferase family 4 protein [Actinomycetota bacterium]|nr:glycosyltransferase family 4 protein [Actinomycetota bacterium]